MSSKSPGSELYSHFIRCLRNQWVKEGRFPTNSDIADEWGDNNRRTS